MDDRCVMYGEDLPSSFSSDPSHRPTAPLDSGGDEPDEPSDAAARTIRSDEREVDFGHGPSIDLRSGFDGEDLPSSFSSDPSHRPTAPLDSGGDEPDEPSDAAARTIRSDEREGDFGLGPSMDLRSGFDGAD